MNFSKDKIDIAVFSSKKLNESDLFEISKNKIENAIKGFGKDEVVITIGNIKNKLLINFIKELGYVVNVVSQRNGSIDNSNKKIIRENEIAVFMIVDDSSNMLKLLDYAIEHNVITIPINIKTDSLS